MKESDIVVTLADSLISCTFLGPLVVMYWRGTWNLLDVYVTPSDAKLSAWISLAIGNIGMLFLAFIGPIFKRKCPTDNLCTWFMVCHLFTYVAGFLSVNQWRGMWNLLDAYTGKGQLSFTACIFVAWSFLATIRCSKMCFAPPLLVAMDTDTTLFDFSTRFQTKPGCTEDYFWDSVLTVCVIGNAVVSFWRGCWLLLDQRVMPDDPVMSAAICVALGYTTLLLCALIQLPINLLYTTFARRGSGRLCLAIIENSLYIIANPAVICLWRGVWLTCDLHLLPQNRAGSSFLTHIVAYTVLSIFLNSNSIVVKGCTLDGENSHENGILFPNEFLRYFSKRRSVNCKDENIEEVKIQKNIFSISS